MPIRREAECMRVEMEELLYSYGLNVVFTGHVDSDFPELCQVHAYERSNRAFNDELDPCFSKMRTPSCRMRRMLCGDDTATRICTAVSEMRFTLAGSWTNACSARADRHTTGQDQANQISMYNISLSSAWKMY